MIIDRNEKEEKTSFFSNETAPNKTQAWQEKNIP